MFEIIERKDTGNFTLHLGEVKQLRLSGWRGIKLYLFDSRGSRGRFPVIEGIFSVGGRDGILPWFDGNYRERQEFKKDGENPVTVVLEEKTDGSAVFHAISLLIPPGGHLMISYEGEDTVHRDTMEELYRNVPPVATRLGSLMFHSGFHYVKDWYLAEGGHEGPRKLWGEKGENPSQERLYLRRTLMELKQFLETHQSAGTEGLIERAKARAASLLGVMGHKVP